jgi:hypothetical protein
MNLDADCLITSEAVATPVGTPFHRVPHLHLRGRLILSQSRRNHGERRRSSHRGNILAGSVRVRPRRVSSLGVA